MATVPPPRATRNLEQDRQRIRSPLARLRKYIHSYVSLEGAALTGLFLAMWFWIGLALDYGLFKAFLFDWVQVMPWGFRLGVLVVVLLALTCVLLLTVLVRMLRQFSDAAMALVLERKFPEVLGDRLITAVELADPQLAAEHGYSADLVRETIHEAADRVDQVPVGQVFDWKRLIRRGVSLVVLTGVMYLLVGAGFCVARSVLQEGDPVAGYADFNEVAGIWVERNILLHNTIWPRRSYLEILPWEKAKDQGRRLAGGASEGDEDEDPYQLSIPQGSVPPPLRVRAWKYVREDGATSEGWRLLTWADLNERPDLAAGAEVPGLPEQWQPRDASTGLTVDEVELFLEAFPMRTTLAGTDLPAKWNIASANEDSGWRKLMWADLTREKLSGIDVPGVPGGWDSKTLSALIAGGAGHVKGDPLGAAARLMAPKAGNVSVDEVEQKLEELEKLPQPPLEARPIRKVIERLKLLASLRETLDQVDATASNRSMRRTMRKLIVPSAVTLTYSSRSSTSTSTMTPIAGNEFSGNFSQLNETVTFTVKGEDYVTPRRTITVVERPRVEKLESEEERPAYLYYRVGEDVTAQDIRLKKQSLHPMALSVTGDTTTMDVPAGTDVVLTATISKPLREFAVSVETKDQKTFRAEQPKWVEEDKERKSFRIRLPDVRREQRFKLTFTDSDRVTGERKVVILPREDTSPRIREFNPDEVIRRGRGNEGFIIGAGCRIPFKGRVGDDHGLARVRYACRVIPADFLSEQKARALFGVAGATLFGPGSNGPLFATAYLTALTRELSQTNTDEAGPEQFIELPAFLSAVRDNRPGDNRTELLSLGTMQSLLEGRQREPYRKLLRDFTLKPDSWVDVFADREEDEQYPNRWYKANDPRSPLGSDLPLWKLTWRDRDGKDRPIKDLDDTKPQKSFIIEVRLITEDNYLDGDLNEKTKEPMAHVSPSGETFTFKVVPENELLSRIGEEEETKYREMQKAHKPLPENVQRMTEIHSTLRGGSADEGILAGFAARCESTLEVLKTSHQDVKGVFTTYEKIVKEMRVNQVREEMIAKVYKSIYVPLSKVSKTQFDETQNAVSALRRALDNPGQPVATRVAAADSRAGEARRQLQDLEKQISAILTAMEGISKLNELIAELARIEKQEEDLESLVSRIYRRRIEEELKRE